MPGLARRVLVLAATAATALAGVLLTGGTGAAAATGCAVSYSVTSQWPGGFTAAVTVRNLGDPLTSWTVAWTYPSGQKISSAWNATVAQDGARVTASSMPYNAAVGTDATAAFGVQGTWNGSNSVPMDFAVNGVVCGGPASPSPSTPTSSTRTPTPSVTPTSGCPESGHLTYTLNRAAAPTADQSSAYALITTAMDQALSVYNCHLNVTKALSVNYDPGVATADANYNGTIRFGARSSMQQITAMHEISHTLGVGTVSAWSSHLSNGIWTGSAATSRLRAITGDQAAAVHGDSQHFWPYGLNYTSEVTSPADLVSHCLMVAALRRDMGL